MTEPRTRLQRALADLCDAVTDALRIPQLLDWLGKALERARVCRWL